MKNLKNISIIIALAGVFCASWVWADPPLRAPTTPSPGKVLGLLPVPTFSLLDPSRLKIQNSYSISYLSSGRNSGSVGLFQTSLSYQLASPLYVRIDLGYLHQPFNFKNNISMDNRVYPNFFINYSPSPNFNISINVLNGPNNNYYNPYGWYQPIR